MWSTRSAPPVCPDVKVIIGGAPVTAEFAREIGADGYAPDAGSAVDVAQGALRSWPGQQAERAADGRWASARAVLAGRAAPASGDGEPTEEHEVVT